MASPVHRTDPGDDAPVVTPAKHSEYSYDTAVTPEATKKDANTGTPDTQEATPEMEEGRSSSKNNHNGKPSMTPLKSDLDVRFLAEPPDGKDKEEKTEAGWCHPSRRWLWVAALVLGVVALVLILVLTRYSEKPAASSPLTAEGLPPAFQPVAPVGPSPPVAPRPVPTAEPTVEPTKIPTTPPVNYPTPKPTPFPTRRPTESPTRTPTRRPTPSPTAAPTGTPTTAPPTADVAGGLSGVLEAAGVVVDEAGPAGPALAWLVEETAAATNGPGALLQAYRADPELLVQRLAVLAVGFGLASPAADNDDGSSTVAIGIPSGGGFFDPGTNRRAAEAVPAIAATLGVAECEWPGIVCNPEGRVTELRMGSMGLGGSIPTEIGLLGALSYLDLAQNDLGGSIPPQIFNMSSLAELYLYQNRLTGTLSSDASEHWNELTQMHLSHNRLTGTIPPEWKSGQSIRKFRTVNLSNNQLTGVIPGNLRWRQCFLLDLSHNQLTGTLPVDLGEKFVILKHLHLNHNRLTGTLPPSYITVGNGRLEQLTINNNQLTGNVPDNHEFFWKLVAYNLQNNDFRRVGGDTCRLSVFNGGENVDFKADCDACRCDNDFFCAYC